MREDEENVMVLECVNGSTTTTIETWYDLMVECRCLDDIRSFVNELNMKFGDNNINVYDEFETFDLVNNGIIMVELGIKTPITPFDIFKEYSLRKDFIITGTFERNDFDTLCLYSFVDGIENLRSL